MKRLSFPMLAALVLMYGCSKDLPADSSPQQVENELAGKPKTDAMLSTINFTEPDLFPEGVVYDEKNNRFYVSSVTRGDIGIVQSNGTYTPFITDPALTATTGLEIDKSSKRLYVSNSPGGVGIYDINTGARINFINLAALLPGAPIFVNDIALDPQGNAYVTNSLTPVIYKITPDGTASIFFQSQALVLPAGQFGFNGIEYANSGFLLVARTATSQVIKIPVREPNTFSIVSLNAPLNRPDGLLLSQNGKQLIVVNNAGGGEGKVLSFTSNNKWDSGVLEETFTTGTVFPTTATSDGKTNYVLYAYLNRRTTGGQSVFSIQELPF